MFDNEEANAWFDGREAHDRILHHHKFNIENGGEYSKVWLQIFKKRHGSKYPIICGEKTSALRETVEKHIEVFAKIISDGNLGP